MSAEIQEILDNAEEADCGPKPAILAGLKLLAVIATTLEYIEEEMRSRTR